MSAKDSVWIGADPGGKKNFGLAILKSNGSAHTYCVDFVDQAIELVIQHVHDVHATPAGVGVDAPLWWSSGRSSGRQADEWLRDRYGLSGGQVQSANSLRGAALVQGAMFVQRMREQFPDVGVTEAHPKAVLKALGISWGAFTKRFSVTVEVKDEQKHERDAVISAVAAREGFERRWPNDLSIGRHPREQDPSSFWLAPIHYYWPDE